MSILGSFLLILRKSPKKEIFAGYMPINKPAILRAVCKNFVFGAYNLDFVGYSEPRLVNEVSLQKDSKIPTSTNQNSDNFQNCHLNWVD